MIFLHPSFHCTLLCLIILVVSFSVQGMRRLCVCQIRSLSSHAVPLTHFLPPSLQQHSRDNHVQLHYESNRLKDMMKLSIMWYKDTLSPIMPPNCRFLPSCSSYALQAIDTFGPWKGGVLTAWRLIRCNPTGGRGYDPPVWPPPGYRAGKTSNFF